MVDNSIGFRNYVLEDSLINNLGEILMILKTTFMTLNGKENRLITVVSGVGSYFDFICECRRKII